MADINSTMINEYDVYCSKRGRGFFNRPGNKKYRDMVEENLERYIKVDKDGKTTIAIQLVTSVWNKQGRFLILDEHGDLIVDDQDSGKLKAMEFQEAIAKCKQDFANLKNRKKRKSQKQALGVSKLPVVQEESNNNTVNVADIALAFSDIDISSLDEVAEAMNTILKVVLNHQNGKGDLKEQVKEVMADETIKTAMESLLTTKLKMNKQPKLELVESNSGVEEKEEHGVKDKPKATAGDDNMTPVDSKLVDINFKLESDLPVLDVVENARLKADREYTGSVLIGNDHGTGCMKYDDGRVASGNWIQNVLHGQACVIYQNGEKFFGNFWKHKRHGKGVYIYKDKSKYVGDFRLNSRHGMGRYISADKKTYIGEFKDGKFEGSGLVLGANGAIEKCGRFEDWELVEKL